MSLNQIKKKSTSKRTLATFYYKRLTQLDRG